jgi:predicted ATP-dependent serine protease
MLAVAEKYLGMNFSNDDVYLNVLNGDLYKTENFDLAVICSILSSKLKRALPNKTVFAGTVSLTNNISAKNIENSIQWLIETGVQEVVTDKNLTDSIMLNNAELKNNIGLQGLSGAKDILQII